MGITDHTATPSIFQEIIKKKVADYIEREVRQLVTAKTAEIVQEVLSGLQLDAQRYADMLRHETNLVVKAIYNGQDVPQREEK